jgi:hypothetical protein
MHRKDLNNKNKIYINTKSYIRHASQNLTQPLYVKSKKLFYF